MKGGIRVLATLAHRGVIKVAVSDTGIGIPKGKQSQVFTLFGKLEGNESINPQGCGLGLGISNMLAEELGGESIRLESQPAVGSTFSFIVSISKFPVSYQSPAGITHGESTADLSSIDEAMGPVDVPQITRCANELSLQTGVTAKVLVVDDSDFNRMVLRKVLKSLGVQCEEANTGLRALHLMQKEARRSHFYRLVLMDLEMPEMDGVAAAVRIREMKGRGEVQEVEIVACSAFSSEEEKTMCVNAGMRAFSICIIASLLEAKDLRALLRTYLYQRINLQTEEKL